MEKTKKGRGMNVLMIVLIAALICLIVFFVSGMTGLIGAPVSAAQRSGTLNGQPLTVDWSIDGEGMATFVARVPADVTDIENIEWMQHDVMDGKESSLFHDGPAETELSITPKTEGTTTITTTVTTASGEVASSETVIDWTKVNQGA